MAASVQIYILDGSVGLIALHAPEHEDGCLIAQNNTIMKLTFAAAGLLAYLLISVDTLPINRTPQDPEWNDSPFNPDRMIGEQVEVNESFLRCVEGRVSLSRSRPR